QHVVAVAAVGDELHAGKAARLDHVVAGKTVDDDAVVGVEVGDVHRFRQARNRDHAIVVLDRDHVVAGGGVDDDRVRRSVATSAAQRSGEVDVDVLHAGSGQVVDRDGVGAAQRVEVDVLDAVEVHGDAGDIAREPHPAAVCRD